MLIKRNATIKFVKGNSFSREYELKNVDLNNVYSIQINCKELDLYTELFSNDEGKFNFYLHSAQTSKMPDIHTTYDLNVVFIDGSVQTVFYQEQFIILPNLNKEE